MVLSNSPATDTGLIPLERELQERLVWFIRLRWLAALGIILGAWGATEFIAVDLSPLPLYAVALVVAGYNLFFSFLRHRLTGDVALTYSHRKLTYAQIGLDWIALICLVHYSGGIQSPVVLAFVFHLIIGAILLSRRACYIQAALAILLSGLLLLVEELGVLPMSAADLNVEGPGGELAGLYRWLILSFFLGVTAFLTTSIIAPLRRKEESLFASERALERAYEEMEALYQVGQAVNSTLDLEQVLGLIAESGARLMGMKACSIRLLEEDGLHLKVGAAYGLSAAYLDKGPVAVERSRINAEALAGNTVQVVDATKDSRFQYPEEVIREGIRAVLCVPMQSMKRSIGCIRIYSGEPRSFSQQEVSLLRNLANLGAVAIENARDYAELQRLDEERAWFAHVTHHQLRSPLAAAKSMLDALRYAGTLSDQQADMVDRSRRRVDELLEMIRDLLDLAGAQRPLEELRPEPIVLLDCLAGFLEMVLDRAAHKQILFDFDVPDTEIAVFADSGDIERIFSNLLDNAIKYTPVGGKVSLRIEMQEDQVLAVVSDSGIGIAQEDQERIFKGFYRTEAAKETGEMGTGMGLSIVKKLVERCRGELKLISAPGEGCRFEVRLLAATGKVSAAS